MQYTEPRGKLESPDNLLLDHSFVKLYKQLEHSITNIIANFGGILKEEEQIAANKAQGATLENTKH